MQGPLSTPACFESPEQYVAWLELVHFDPRIPIIDGMPSHCFDCTLPFQRKMLHSRRCAHPEVRFAFVEGIACDPDITVAGFSRSNGV
jgi:hypothetical protein